VISTAVVAHEARITAATELAKNLDAVLTVDDGSLGAEANHLRAWQATGTVDADWALVLEDDAIPVPNFLEQAKQALAVAPAPIVSFYLGKNKPKAWQHRIAQALDQADMAGAHWIDTHYLLHAVAVAMRSDLREDWLDWAPHHDFPIDQRLSEWARCRGHRIAYSLPSLVDHADWPTLVQHRDRQPRIEPRIAWRTGTRDQWSRRTVTI
jgi:GR25 family glycosyltransferase involved in LPS biosynthesis